MRRRALLGRGLATGVSTWAGTSLIDTAAGAPAITSLGALGGLAGLFGDFGRGAIGKPETECSLNWSIRPQFIRLGGNAVPSCPGGVERPGQGLAARNYFGPCGP